MTWPFWQAVLNHVEALPGAISPFKKQLLDVGVFRGKATRRWRDRICSR